MLLTVCFAAAPLTACGNDSEKDIKKLNKEIGKLQERCEELESELEDAQSAIDHISGILDDDADSIHDLKNAFDSLYDYVGDLAEAITEIPEKEETTVNKKSSSGGYTNDNGYIYDSDNANVAVKFTYGGTSDVPYSPVDDEKIAPSGTDVSDYEPVQKSDYAFWLDISEEKDFIFNGETVCVTMKIKKDAPDGVYPIVIRSDLSDVSGHELFTDEDINGSICINTKASPFDADSTDDFVFYGDSVACKPGDTVEFNISIANNPGLAAFVVYIYYDSNAIEIEDMEAAGEFKKINDKW